MEEVCIRNLRGNESLDELGRCVPRDESATATLIAHILGKIISQYLSMCYLRRSDAREAKKFFGISNAWAQGIAYMIFQARRIMQSFVLLICIRTWRTQTLSM